MGLGTFNVPGNLLLVSSDECVRGLKSVINDMIWLTGDWLAELLLWWSELGLQQWKKRGECIEKSSRCSLPLEIKRLEFKYWLYHWALNIQVSVFLCVKEEWCRIWWKIGKIHLMYLAMCLTKVN